MLIQIEQPDPGNPLARKVWRFVVVLDTSRIEVRLSEFSVDATTVTNATTTTPTGWCGRWSARSRWAMRTPKYPTRCSQQSRRVSWGRFRRRPAVATNAKGIPDYARKRCMEPGAGLRL